MSRAEDDGLDALRQRIRRYGLQPNEEKMLLLLRELKADEQRYLTRFAKAEDEGATFPPACMSAAILPACL